MILTQAKPFEEILDSLKDKTKIFLIGCGECATACKTGGEPELLLLKQKLEEAGKTVIGWCIPQSTCVSAKLKSELAKQIINLRKAEVVLVLSCGLGVQSVKDNDRLGLVILPANNTVAAVLRDSQGRFLEKCSFCGECLLDKTEGICPITLCPKGLLNGPCGGMDKGKCEVDKNRDCAWVLIWKEAQNKNNLEIFKRILPARDYTKSIKPHFVQDIR
ncbi:MAG: methylenetetrahydrofolate reductase C-terminal domain-containing protein [Candidatus Omnitrophica bacterium]|nr:methylenetetrahydrofolate reductase C-terminal domain-containing protein [Candidatus Omnitrophota bacterium]